MKDPALLVVAGVAAGLVVAGVHHARTGMWVICASLALGALLRLVLRPARGGTLVVRSRQIDVVVLATLAGAIGVLAAVIPFHHHHP